jgi:hypothetical protein
MGNAFLWMAARQTRWAELQGKKAGDGMPILVQAHPESGVGILFPGRFRL